MTDRPNILLITTDQQRTDSLGCYGSRFTHTPHLDRLTAEGIRFDRAYCANPVCTPSRASIFTGRRVSRHGAWNVGLNLAEDERLISHLLRDVGYQTHYIGKTHFQAYGVPPASSVESSDNKNSGRFAAFSGPYYGFETVELAGGHTLGGLSVGHYGQWVLAQAGPEALASYRKAKRLSSMVFGGEAYDWPIPLKYHNSVWTADRTVDFLRRHDSATPFLLAVGFQDPHHPHCVPVEFTDRVDPAQVPLPDYVKGELDDKPPHFSQAHHGALETSPFRGEYWIAGQETGADFSRVTESEARLGRAYYYSMVKLIDQQMGRILECLDQTGLADNTLVIFTSDHGELLGDHGLWMKGPFHYEQLIRVPLLMRWPKEFKGGRKINEVFSHLHLAPTILAAAGAPGAADMDGLDALALLRGETERGSDEALIECIDDPQGLRLKTLVTDRWKLTWYCGQDFGELYDLAVDPHERVNRWAEPDSSGQRDRLLRRLLDWSERLENRTTKRLSYA